MSRYGTSHEKANKTSIRLSQSTIQQSPGYEADTRTLIELKNKKIVIILAKSNPPCYVIKVIERERESLVLNDILQQWKINNQENSFKMV